MIALTAEQPPIKPRAGRVERLCNDAGHEPFLLDLRGAGAELAGALAEPRLERYIGGDLPPRTEQWSRYSGSSLSRQYDGWVCFDETRAVSALKRPAVPAVTRPTRSEFSGWVRTGWKVDRS